MNQHQGLAAELFFSIFKLRQTYYFVNFLACVTPTKADSGQKGAKKITIWETELQCQTSNGKSTCANLKHVALASNNTCDGCRFIPGMLGHIKGHKHAYYSIDNMGYTTTILTLSLHTQMPYIHIKCTYECIRLQIDMETRSNQPIRYKVNENTIKHILINKPST